MSLCRYCVLRKACEGCRDGCDYFLPDWFALEEEQRAAIRRMLTSRFDHEEERTTL